VEAASRSSARRGTACASTTRCDSTTSTGDGAYGDGPQFHWDYYNSFVIQPMLLDVLDACRDESAAWKDLAGRVEPRARRYAAVLERLIAPDGTFPPIGRSIAYRFGALQVLAQIALRRALPDSVSPRRCAAPSRRSFAARSRCRERLTSKAGCVSASPVISPASASDTSRRKPLPCAVGLLPLGLPASDDFWSARRSRGRQRARGQGSRSRSIGR
jgi:hypothetical protein